ncbi:MAG TPA: hypothetical protein VIA06_02575 [Candidatus Dormibacteraeota bacterium]|nr:hypothetical protein [Candidatus Dormibacteraeota bacterium]
MLDGLNPENVRIALHALGSLSSILCGVLGMLLLGLAVWPARRLLAAVSVALGVSGLVAFVLLESVHYGPLGAGGDERLALGSVGAWMAAVGISFLVGYGGGRDPLAIQGPPNGHE